MTIKPASSGYQSFADTLSGQGARLERDELSTLQVNVGLTCQLACRHCHLEAGPAREERMDRLTMERVADLARRHPFKVIDITGGEPALNPELPWLLAALAPHTPRLLMRTNLVTFAAGGHPGGDEAAAELLDLCRDLGVVLMASLPSLERNATETQRGGGTLDRSLAALAMLNEQGYGMPGSDLELILISNPGGACLPPPQQKTEQSFTEQLKQNHGLYISRLFTLGNAPVGRHKGQLKNNGDLDAYMKQLQDNFNILTLPALMCRTLLAVRWDGALFDCDFNLAMGLERGAGHGNISTLAPEGLPGPGAPIAVGDHCYACTAGSGFT